MTFPSQPALSIVIPCFNEANRIGPTLDAIASFLREKVLDVQVIVVDDGSSDGTASGAMARSQQLPRLTVVRHEFNTGKGFAVRAGVLAAAGAQVLFVDADLSTPPDQIPRLLARLDAGADVAIGSRRMAGSRILLAQPPMRRLMGSMFVLLQRLLVGGAFTDTQCGFKAFKRDVAIRLFSRALVTGFCFDVEVLALARLDGLRIDDVPVLWMDDRDSRIRPLWDGARMLYDLLRIRWYLLSGRYR